MDSNFSSPPPYNATDHPDDPFSNTLSNFLLVLKGTTMITIISIAVFGNSLVIISVFKYERLRVITNFFIVSLAFADLLVAMLVMPFSMSMEMTEGRWMFGRIMCDIFNANDVLFSTASLIHLCCISMDRYLAILHPLRYEAVMNKHRAMLMLGVSWVASILISYIPVFSRLYTTEAGVKEHQLDSYLCNFTVNPVYAAVSSSVSFWIPTLIMMFVYARIFLEARKQERLIQSSAMYMHYTTRDHADPDVQRFERRKMKREHKAAKTLGIIMGCFILCFVPFFCWYVVTAACKTCANPPALGSVLFWCGYSNSCLNPIIYAYYNREFRTAFKKILNMDRGQTEQQASTVSDPCIRPLNTSYGNSIHRNSVPRNSIHRDSCNATIRQSFSSGSKRVSF